MRLYSPIAQRLGVRLNGKKKLETSVEIAQEGFSTIVLSPESGAFVAGENEVLLFASKKPLDIAWIQFGGAEGPDKVPSGFDIDKGALTLTDALGLTYYVAAPEKGRVVGNLSEAGCEIEVSATSGAGKTATGALKGLGSAVELL